MMEEMEGTIIELQEMIYKIQISNFNEVKEIIKDNSGKAEFFAVISLILIFIIFIFILKNSMNLKEIIKKKNLFISSIYHELASSTQAIVIAADIIEHELTQSELKNEVKLISFHIDKIIEQTKEVMDYSKIEMGDWLINESTFDELLEHYFFNNSVRVDTEWSYRKVVRTFLRYTNKTPTEVDNKLVLEWRRYMFLKSRNYRLQPGTIK